MALTVEDGTGLSTANAYIDVAFADGYHQERCQDEWAGNVTAKEAAIIKATEYLDRNYRFQGSLVKDRESDPEQALAWPRTGVVDDDGREIADDAVPTLVQRATAELALLALTLGTLEATQETARLLRQTERTGDMSTAMTFDGGMSIVDINGDGQFAPLGFPLVDALISPLVADIQPTLVRA